MKQKSRSRSLFGALTLAGEGSFSSSGRRSGDIKRPEPPELGPVTNLNRIAGVRGDHRNTTAGDRLEAREFSRFHSSSFFGRVRNRCQTLFLISNYRSGPQHPGGHARGKYAELLLSYPPLFRPRLPVRVTTPRGSRIHGTSYALRFYGLHHSPVSYCFIFGHFPTRTQTGAVITILRQTYVRHAMLLLMRACDVNL
jgi:hypothetical protein